MAHTRIGEFNTKERYPGQNLNNDPCLAVVAEGGESVWSRGQCPQGLNDTKTVNSHDSVGQTCKVTQILKRLIKEAGGEMALLVKVVVYITDFCHRVDIYQMKDGYPWSPKVAQPFFQVHYHSVSGQMHKVRV